MRDPAGAATHLLDVNVLVALTVPDHVHHAMAHRWFEKVGSSGFATCAITENGLLRIVGHPRYPGGAGTPAAAITALRAVRGLTGHHFWTGSISLLGSEVVDASRISSHTQVTDTYLLALAVTNGGLLATFDRRLVTSAVADGRQALHVIGTGA